MKMIRWLRQLKWCSFLGLGLSVCVVMGGSGGIEAQEKLSKREVQAGVLLLKAQKHEAREQWEEMAAAYRQVIELAPELFEPYYMLALYHIGVDEGQRYFEQATQQFPDIAAPYYWHGYVDYKNGNPEQAKPYLTKFLEVAQNDSSEADGNRVQTAKELLEALENQLPFPYPETEQ